MSANVSKMNCCQLRASLLQMRIPVCQNTRVDQMSKTVVSIHAGIQIECSVRKQSVYIPQSVCTRSK